MTTGEIVDTALRLYQRLGTTFLRISVVPALLCLASLAFVSAYVLPGLFYNEDGGQFVTHVVQVAAALALALGVGGPLFLSGVAYTTCVVVNLVSDWFLGNPTDTEAAVASARAAMPRLLAVSFRELFLALSGIIFATAMMVAGEWIETQTPETNYWAGIVVLVGIIGLFGGVLIFLAIVARDGVAAPATILENLSGCEVGRRSRYLLGRGPMHPAAFGAMWSLYLLLAFLAIVLLGGIYIIAGLLGLDDMVDRMTAGMFLRPLILQLFGLVPIFLTIWTLLPVWATSVTILYFDRRVRLEGFDIEVLGRDLAHQTHSSRLQL